MRLTVEFLFIQTKITAWIFKRHVLIALELFSRKCWIYRRTYWYQPFSSLQTSTVDSRYLEVQGTLWNTSRYPYLDISDLQNWGKKINQTTTVHKWICNLTPENRDILKILWKRGEIAPYEQFLLFSTLFCYLLS